MLYKVLTNLTHDGMVYPAGSEVELDKKTATALMNDGVIQDPADVEDTTPTKVERTPKPPKTETKKEKEGKEKDEDKNADGDQGKEPGTGKADGDNL